MLYDKRWDKKADLTFAGVSLLSFIAWLETKPADEEYNFIDPTVCAAAQYLRSRGLPSRKCIIDFGPRPEPGDEGYWLCETVEPLPRTFGAALERARKYASTESR